MTDMTCSQPGEGVIGDAALTHGTLENRNLDKARELYETVLGLRCVRHSPRSQLVAGAGGVAVVCVETGTAAHVQGEENRWVVLAGSEQALDDVRRAAALSDSVVHLGEIEPRANGKGFLLQDSDSNWWDVTSLSNDHYRRIFEAGDIEPAVGA